jgi:hypothetical protein
VSVQNNDWEKERTSERWTWTSCPHFVGTSENSLVVNQ